MEMQGFVPNNLSARRNHEERTENNAEADRERREAPSLRIYNDEAIPSTSGLNNNNASRNNASRDNASRDNASRDNASGVNASSDPEATILERMNNLEQLVRTKFLQFNRILVRHCLRTERILDNIKSHMTVLLGPPPRQAPNRTSIARSLRSLHRRTRNNQRSARSLGTQRSNIRRYRLPGPSLIFVHDGSDEPFEWDDAFPDTPHVARPIRALPENPENM